MKYLIIFFLVTLILKDCFCGKKKGVCNYQPSHSQEELNLVAGSWRVYGYIESKAPYRNPFYIHFGESPDCGEITITKQQNGKFNRIGITIHCLLTFKGRCKYIQLQPNKAGTFTYFPFTTDHNCKEWSAIDRYHTDFVNYFIMFGCENDVSEHSHYIGLWIFIRSDTLGTTQTNQIEKEEEERIKQKIHRIIDTDYRDIKRDITFVSNWTHRSVRKNCTCQGERPFETIYSTTTVCQFERLDTCVPKEVKNSVKVFEEFGIPILFIILIVILLASVAYEYLHKC